MKLAAAFAVAAATSALGSDWLLTPPTPTSLQSWTLGALSGVVLSNGLLSRYFTTSHGWATWDLTSHLDQDSDSLLRAFAPEVTLFASVNTSLGWPVGGLSSGPHLNRSVTHGPFLNRTGLDAPGALVPTPSAFTFVNYTSGPIVAEYAWTPGSRGSDPSLPWPPKGLSVIASFLGVAPPFLGCAFTLTYDMFDGLPAMSKRAHLLGGNATLSELHVEELALNPPFSPVATRTYSQSNGIDGAPTYPGTGKLSVLVDLQYGTVVNHTNDMDAAVDPVLPGPDAGSSQPRVVVGDAPGLSTRLRDTPWTSVRAFLLLHDDGPEQGVAVSLFPASENYWGCTLGPCAPGSGSPLEGAFTERRGLAIRRLLLTIAPQVAESPLQLHLRVADTPSVRAACDQLSSVGWDQLIISNGFDLESDNATYIAEVASNVAYCGSLRPPVEVGGYDLIGWTRGNGPAGWAATNPDGSDSGNSCWASGWAAHWTSTALRFAAATGVAVYETDGPYAGYPCSNASHGHTPTSSVQEQVRGQGAAYTALRGAGVHINAPDSYFTSGTNKMGIGYSENTARLAHETARFIYRQTIFDATYYTQPAAAWSQLPLSGIGCIDGSTDCLYEPVSQNLVAFEAALAQHLLLGVSSFLYSGDMLFDTPAARAVYEKWTTVFHKHRYVLSTGDLIHVRRPDGQGLDAVLHAVPVGRGGPGGLLVVWNGGDSPVDGGRLLVAFYFARLVGCARLTWQPWPGEAPPAWVDVALDWRSRGVVFVSVAGRGVAWAVVEACG